MEKRYFERNNVTEIRYKNSLQRFVTKIRYKDSLQKFRYRNSLQRFLKKRVVKVATGCLRSESPFPR